MLEKLALSVLLLSLWLETLMVAMAGGAVKETPLSPPAASTASCTTAAAPSSTTAAAALLPVGFPPVVPALVLAFFLWALVPVLTVLAAVAALYPAGVTLSKKDNPAAHSRVSVRQGASQGVHVYVPQLYLDIF